jgi:hypothetical protein
MKDYRILEELSAYDLQQRVLDYAKQGWYVQGGVVVYPAGYRTYYAQAMVKS